MSSYYVHLCLFFFLSILFLFSVYVSIIVSIIGSFFVSCSFLSTSSLSLNVSLFFDPFSSWFLSTVLLISSIIMVYSFFYIAPYTKSTYFLTLTLIFVGSMCLVILMPNLFFVILGWDGLGLVSFFLIVYYQNQSSIFSGLFTIMINRIGDAFFLCTIILFSSSFSSLTFFDSSLSSNISLLFLLVTFITNSAIFPFSPWLPIAIAAPTPISALVHSSTLVTAGLFLIINYCYLLYSSYSLMLLLLILSIFTSFYAGINTIFENDLKKLIALSTLSHLGFIGMSFSLGLLSLSFFHLLSHALFKSLLFMSIGDIMINLGHSQDIRYLSSGSLSTPNSCFVMYVSLLNLIGIPSLSGFFSKDLILEASNYTTLSTLLYIILLFNLFFTFYYTYQLFYYSFSTTKFSTYSIFHFSSLLHSVLLLALASFSIIFGKFFLSHISSFTLFLPLPLPLKFIPYFISFLLFLYLYVNLGLFTSNSQILNSYFSTIIFLYLFMTKSSSNFYFLFSSNFSNSVESGFLHSSFNVKLPSFLYFIGNKFISANLFSPLIMSILVFAFFPFLFIF